MAKGCSTNCILFSHIHFTHLYCYNLKSSLRSRRPQLISYSELALVMYVTSSRPRFCRSVQLEGSSTHRGVSIIFVLARGEVPSISSSEPSWEYRSSASHVYWLCPSKYWGGAKDSSSREWCPIKEIS